MIRILAALILLCLPASATVSCATLGDDFTSSAASFTTIPLTPTANRLELLSIHTNLSTTNGATIPTSVTYNGTGLTFVQIGSGIAFGTAVGTGTTYMLTLWRALGSAVTPGSITVSFSPNQSARWILDECSGVDTTGSNGSGAVVQAVESGNGHSVQPATVTMAAFADPANASYGVAAFNNTAVFLAGTDMTIIGDVTSSTFEMVSEWFSANENPIQVNWSNSIFYWGMVGLELSNSNVAPLAPTMKLGGHIKLGGNIETQ